VGTLEVALGRCGAARPAPTISVGERDRQPGAERISILAGDYVRA